MSAALRSFTAAEKLRARERERERKRERERERERERAATSFMAEGLT